MRVGRGGAVERNGLVEAAACMVVILRADGVIGYFSPYSQELTGYRAEEVVGKTFQDVFVPESARAEFDEAVTETLRGRPTKSYETPILRREGRLRWLVWNARRLDDFDGEPAVLAVGQDVTERREAHERMLRDYFPNVRVVTYSRADWMYADLKANKVAGVFGDGMRLALWLDGQDAAGCCRFAGGPYLAPEYLGQGLAIAVRGEDQALVQALDHALQAIAVKGTFAELYLRYFPISFY